MFYAQLIIHHLELVAVFSQNESTLSLQRLCPYYYRPAWQRGRVWQEGGVRGRGRAWQGGVHGRGACMAGGGVRVAEGCAWQGACMACTPPWQILQLRHTVNERVVRILLECILVFS